MEVLLFEEKMSEVENELREASEGMRKITVKRRKAEGEGLRVSGTSRVILDRKTVSENQSSEGEAGLAGRCSKAQHTQNNATRQRTHHNTPHVTSHTSPHRPPSTHTDTAQHTRPPRHRHITITRVATVPPRGCPGNANHVIWKPCFFACVRVVCCFGDSGTVSPLHASEVGCANSGSTVGLCSDLPFMVQVSIFLHAGVGLQASPRCSAVSTLSPSRQIPCARSTADRQATCQVASTQASTSKNESTKVCVPLAHDFELVDMLARKVVLWITPSGGKDAQTAVRRPPPDLWQKVQSEAELNKRLLAELGEVFRSVTSSPPARCEEGARDQQAQAQRLQEGKKNRPSKRKAERDDSLVGGQRLVDRMSKSTLNDPLVRIKQFLRAERDAESTGKDKKINVRVKIVRAPVVAMVDPVVRSLWGRLLARRSRTTGC